MSKSDEERANEEEVAEATEQTDESPEVEGHKWPTA